MTIKLYDLVQKENGNVTVQTELSPEDMLALLTIGFYACLDRGVMVPSLAGHFNPPNTEMSGSTVVGEAQTIDYNDYLDVGEPQEEGPKNA